MNKTTIEWTDYTWNPVTGCNKVSAGCRSCYAETIATRFWGTRKFTDVQMHEDRLNEPQQNKKKWAGKKVFVCSMSDLFHEDVTYDFIRDVWVEIYRSPNTIFQILTKRPERAIDVINRINEVNLWGYTLHNVWIGVSCENQEQANIRIPLLLQIPAAVRFLSCEPLIGPIDFHFKSNCMDYNHADFGCPGIDDSKIHWVIAGGESGHNARPMHPDWVRSLRDQCATANVPFFFKQWGEYVPLNEIGGNFDIQKVKRAIVDEPYNHLMYKIGKSKSGNTLDGKQYLNFPL